MTGAVCMQIWVMQHMTIHTAGSNFVVDAFVVDVCTSMKRKLLFNWTAKYSPHLRSKLCQVIHFDIISQDSQSKI